ncbi:MAG: transketolase [Patescibacteria group bacterium]
MNNPFNYNIDELKKTANIIRQDLIKMLVEAGSGHTAGPLGMADIFTAFYFNLLRYDTKDIENPNRDRLILSNGHICPIRYTAMAHAGFFEIEELKTFRKFNTRLEGHPSIHSLPGLETSSGPLGEGLSLSSGIALASRMRGEENDYNIFCLMSDAEQEEGMTWEAAMFASKYKLSNLIGIIDYNNIQIDGKVEDVMPLEPIVDKYKAFNWSVMEMNGNDMEDILNTINKAIEVKNKPTMIIARNTPGKGVSMFENNYKWHGITPNKEQGNNALRELQHNA